MRKNILVATNAQKVLHFLIDHPIRDFLESEIQKATNNIDFTATNSPFINEN
ncbi:hypothetical protein KKC91_03695 [bacterium]|nr:hypothetical protein [bacterium]